MNIRAEKLKLIKLVLDTEKEVLLAEVGAVFTSENGNNVLSSAQETELDYRLERYKRGETKFYSWEDVEQKLKDVL